MILFFLPVSLIEPSRSLKITSNSHLNFPFMGLFMYLIPLNSLGNPEWWLWRVIYFRQTIQYFFPSLIVKNEISNKYFEQWNFDLLRVLRASNLRKQSWILKINIKSNSKWSWGKIAETYLAVKCSWLCLKLVGGVKCKLTSLSGFATSASFPHWTLGELVHCSVVYR